MIGRNFRLFAALFGFGGAEVVRSRAAFFAAVLGLVAAMTASLAVRASGGEARGIGIAAALGMWAVAAPFCRSWVDDDVRLGLAGFWLQKPLRPLQFYMARLLALVVWAVIGVVAVTLAALPGLVMTGGSRAAIGLILAAGWIPPLLVVLSFVGSGLGAKNGALFGYAVLFAGFAFPGLADALKVGASLELLRVLLPPAGAGYAALAAFGTAGLAAGLAHLITILVYGWVVAVLGVALTLRVPGRLGRSE